MKKFFMLLAVAIVGISMTGCYDDDALWNEMESVKNRVTTLEEAVQKTNGDLTALQTIVSALQKNVYVSEVNQSANGYVIKFTDGKTATITNGTNGVDAPVISIKQDEDGKFYWTQDGEWLLIDGEKVLANGENGKDAVAPQVRINETSKEWEISTDGGETWNSTGVTAEGKNTESNSLFKSVDTSNDEYVVFTLADDTEFKLVRYDESMPLFTIIDAPEVAQVEYGKSVKFAVNANNIKDYTIYAPEGWRVSYAEDSLSVTAPAKDLCHFSKEGVIAIMIVSEAGKSAIVKLNVMAGEWVEETTLRILTFEDKDAKFNSYDLNYCGATIRTWSDLIAADQYMDGLIYDMSGSEPYTWYDEGNTELAHSFPYNYGCYAYWGGGHAISNYANEDFETYGDYMSQLTVFGEEGAGGHNGSANFCMHFGYVDGSVYNQTDELSSIFFADGKARVIDHLWVNNSNYVLNCLLNGNGLTDPMGEDDSFYLIATGYDEDDNVVGTSTFNMANSEKIVKEWAKWDLTSLGKVARVEFNVGGTNDNGYGFSQPAYFAYDDVAVQFNELVFK